MVMRWHIRRHVEIKLRWMPSWQRCRRRVGQFLRRIIQFRSQTWTFLGTLDGRHSHDDRRGRILDCKQRLWRKSHGTGFHQELWTGTMARLCQRSTSSLRMDKVGCGLEQSCETTFRWSWILRKRSSHESCPGRRFLSRWSGAVALCSPEPEQNYPCSRVGNGRCNYPSLRCSVGCECRSIFWVGSYFFH